MTTMAEAQAMGLCWIARQPGLPEGFDSLRSAVAQLHTLSCGWCDYPLEELMKMLLAANVARSDEDNRRWEGLPGRAKREAIRLAQGNEAAA